MCLLTISTDRYSDASGQGGDTYMATVMYIPTIRTWVKGDYLYSLAKVVSTASRNEYTG